MGRIHMPIKAHNSTLTAWLQSQKFQTKRTPELWNLKRWRKSLSQILHAMGKNQDLLKANFHQQFISFA